MTATTTPVHTEGFTRPPTGRPLPPVILVDGIAHGGKSTLAYRLSASQRVHRTFVFEVGERDADQYQRLGPYEIVLLDGSWSDFIAKLAWAVAQPHPEGVPNVIVIDTISRLWEDLKDWASNRARSSRAAVAKLRDDPDAYIDVTSNYWNDAKDRWGQMLRTVSRFDGITILIARGDEVTAFEDGQPVYNATTWSIEAEKRTKFNVTANVSIRKPHRPVLMSTKNLDVNVPTDGIPLAESDAMDDLIFRILATPTDTAAVAAVGAAPGVPSAQAKAKIKDVYLAYNFNEDDARSATLDLWKSEVGPGVGEIAASEVERLVDLAKERLANPSPPTAEAPAQTAAPAPADRPATDPAATSAEGDGAAETGEPGDSDGSQPPADLAIANDDHPAPDDEAAGKYPPDVPDPVRVAREFADYDEDGGEPTS